MQDLEKKFNRNLEKWRMHCILRVYSSDFADFLNCKVYRKIISLGKPVLPLIRKAYVL